MRFGIRYLIVALIVAAASPSRPTKPQSISPPIEPRQVESVELKEGQVVGRGLKGGEAHSYRVRLAAGQYLRAVVEQQGVDVVVRLFAPDGKQVTEVGSPNEAHKPISVVAEAGGDYRLEVGALGEKAAPGRYEVKVEELRGATARDRDRVAAESAARRASAGGESLRIQGTAESFRKSLEKYEEALSLWRAAGNREQEAVTLNQLGDVYWRLSYSQKALEYYGQALPLWQAAGDREAEANTLNSIGTVYSQLGESQKALEYHNRALPVMRAVGNRELEAVTLNETGLAYAYLGKLQEALNHYKQALAIQHSLGDRGRAVNTINNIGAAYYRLGEWQKALGYFNQALALARALGDRRGEALGLNNIGAVYEQLGESRKALEYYDQALPLRRATGDRSGEIVSLLNIGKVQGWLSEPRKALEYLNQALALARALGDRRREATALYGIGVVYESLGDLQKALDFLNQALPLQRALAVRREEAITLSRTGATYTSLGKPGEALGYLEQALSLHRAVGDRGNEARTLLNIARAERERGRLAEARARIEAALDILEETRSQFINQQLRTSFSASRQDLYKFYVDLLMRMHKEQPSAGHDAAALKASERARARSLIDLLTESHADIRQGVDAALLERERALRQQLNVKAERLTRLLAGKHTEEQAAARKEVEALLADQQEVEAQIRAKSPRYAGLTQPRPLSVKEIQRQVLDDDTLLLEYSLDEERSYLWAVTTTSVAGFELPKRAEIESQARLVYGLFTARNQVVSFETADKRRARVAKADADYPRAAGALSRVLLGPVAGQMKNKRLLVVGDGALQYLPFAALPLPGPAGRETPPSDYVPLVAEHEVVSLPSASTLAVLRKELSGRKPAPKTVAVLADPVFDVNDERVRARKTTAVTSVRPARGVERGGDGDTAEDSLIRSLRDLAAVDDESPLPLPRLPFTKREAEAITALAPAGQSVKALDFAASRAAATDPRLSQYRYIHFATHAVLNTRHPELSGVVLSLVDREGKEQDGFLLAHEVYNLNLPAEVVVLSGCRTGLGKEVKGEGLISLTRGFMYAGGARVLVSLWDVNDRSTAELMTRFYEGVLGKERLSPAAALRRAQVAMWESARWRAPYYWGAFVLHGEYR